MRIDHQKLAVWFKWVCVVIIGLKILSALPFLFLIFCVIRGAVALLDWLDT